MCQNYKYHMRNQIAINLNSSKIYFRLKKNGRGKLVWWFLELSPTLEIHTYMTKFYFSVSFNNLQNFLIETGFFFFHQESLGQKKKM